MSTLPLSSQLSSAQSSSLVSESMEDEPPVRRGRGYTGQPKGRPPGAKNKPKVPDDGKPKEPKKKGRPPGAKNKPKPAVTNRPNLVPNVSSQAAGARKTPLNSVMGPRTTFKAKRAVNAPRNRMTTPALERAIQSQAEVQPETTPQAGPGLSPPVDFSSEPSLPPPATPTVSPELTLNVGSLRYYQSDTTPQVGPGSFPPTDGFPLRPSALVSANNPTLAPEPTPDFSSDWLDPTLWSA